MGQRVCSLTAVRLAMGLAILAFGVGVTGAPARAGDDRAIGFVKTVNGTAQILRAGLTWPMKPGAAIYEGDVVATEADGSFGITFKDDTRISAGPDTRLELKSFAFEPVQGELSSIIGMVKGSILYISGAIAKLAPDAAKVETPRGTIAVRGTRFLVRVGE